MKMSVELFKQVVNQVQHEIYYEEMAEQLRKAKGFFVKGKPIKVLEIINSVIKDLDWLRSSTTSKE